MTLYRPACRLPREGRGATTLNVKVRQKVFRSITTVSLFDSMHGEQPTSRCFPQSCKQHAQRVAYALATRIADQPVHRTACPDAPWARHPPARCWRGAARSTSAAKSRSCAPLDDGRRASCSVRPVNSADEVRLIEQHPELLFRLDDFVRDLSAGRDDMTDPPVLDRHEVSAAAGPMDWLVTANSGF
jgi:hypothetical protein